MNTSSSYDTYAKYYDEIVEKRRDFGAIAKTLADLIGDRKKVLDIGVGTGSVIEKLLQLNPQQYEFWGIDNSKPLLDKAKAKFESNSQVHLHLEDVLDFDLGQTFEVIYSRGGAFFFMGNTEEILFASHILSRGDNLNALKSTAKHLQASGTFLLSVVDFKRDEDKELDNGITYRRRTKRTAENGHEYLTINLSFETEGKVIGDQTLKLLLMKRDAFQEMLSEAGFQFNSISSGSQYYIYSKK